MARTYCIGLPVIITVEEDGTVTVEVDLSEASRERDLSESLEGREDAYSDEEVEADSRVIHTALAAAAQTCPHCGSSDGLYGEAPDRGCVDCYWQEGDDPEALSQLSSINDKASRPSHIAPVNLSI